MRWPHLRRENQIQYVPRLRRKAWPSAHAGQRTWQELKREERVLVLLLQAKGQSRAMASDLPGPCWARHSRCNHGRKSYRVLGATTWVLKTLKTTPGPPSGRAASALSASESSSPTPKPEFLKCHPACGSRLSI